MENNNGTDFNAGATGDGSQGLPDAGNQGGDPSSNSGVPENQGGQPDPSQDWASKEENYKKQLSALNRQLIEARRGKGNQNGQQDNQGAYDTPEGQYAMALKVATGDLRGRMEDVLPLYPEIPASEMAMVRKNPWAYASQQSYQAGDWETAAMEIEQYLYDRALELGSNPGNNANPNGVKPSPANVNGNPAPTAPNPNADPGSDEDEDDWTMPIDKLEKKVRKVQAKSQPK